MTRNLTLAIEERRWEAAALYLILGVSRTAVRLTPESIDALLALLERAPATKALGR